MAKTTLYSDEKEFVSRHIGPRNQDLGPMLKQLGVDDLNQLIQRTTPKSIQDNYQLDLPKALTEPELLQRAQTIAKQNKVNRSFIGLGYYDCITPPVILRNILENPGWYTAYTPYQAEISQGRMEALLNFQTMVTDLTGMEISNASLLDEGTAAAEALTLCRSVNKKSKAKAIFVDDYIFPQTLEVLNTRTAPLGIEIIRGSAFEFNFSQDVFAAFVQYPNSTGEIKNYESFFEKCHSHNCLAIAIADLLALSVLKPPGEMGADVVVGSSQRFGVPMGFGGPHAAFLATKEAYKRNVPGRIIGLSKDVHGNPSLRLALQTREQHIRREKATSNICTAQVLLAVMASSYGVYHGPKGLKRIALDIHKLTRCFAQHLEEKGFKLCNTSFFDTVTFQHSSAEEIYQKALQSGINILKVSQDTLRISFDETKTWSDLQELASIFTGETLDTPEENLTTEGLLPSPQWDPQLHRTSSFMTHPTFNLYHSETELLRYLKRLENKDLTLTHAMIPLGSCTMKLNATSEMIPVTWPEFGKIHPFAPLDQAQGYLKLIKELEHWICEMTGFAACSLQPNAGSQGEYAGLLVIQKYHQSKGEGHRKICLIPSSAHGTNPASAVMAGMEVVVVHCDSEGNIDLKDLKAKAELYKEQLSALMITYPSTHGVFEDSIKEICKTIHEFGGQVYMDGANFNALIGITRPGQWGADVSHLNLHKTFCIPHGGGGPRHWPYRGGQTLKTFFTHTLNGPRSWPSTWHLCHLCSPLGQCKHPSHLLGLYRYDGSSRSHHGNKSGYTQRQLHCKETRVPLRHSLQGQFWTRRP